MEKTLKNRYFFRFVRKVLTTGKLHRLQLFLPTNPPQASLMPDNKYEEQWDRFDLGMLEIILRRKHVTLMEDSQQGNWSNHEDDQF